MPKFSKFPMSPRGQGFFNIRNHLVLFLQANSKQKGS